MSALSSEFCTVQVLERPKNLSTLTNSKMSAFGSILKHCINSVLIETAIGRCLLKEVIQCITWSTVYIPFVFGKRPPY